MSGKKYTVEEANLFIEKNKHLVNTQYKPEEHFTAEIGWIKRRISSLLSILSVR